MTDEEKAVPLKQDANMGGHTKKGEAYVKKSRE